MQAALWSVVGASMTLAILAGWADRRRSRQDGMGRVGWVPWTGLTVALLFVGVGTMVLALHG